MADAAAPWRLTGFLERLEVMLKDEIDQTQRKAIRDWLIDLFLDPYQGATREPVAANLWRRKIPGTDTAEGRQVVCVYWIEEETRSVRCDMYAILRPPF